MPNHVINEIIINVPAEKQAAILEKIKGKNDIDFSVLLPLPLNIWMGSVGSEHTATFPDTALDWSTKNWGTKWNAYGLYNSEIYKPIVLTENSITLTFQTAWRPPFGWIVALFNHFKISFKHNYLSEDDDGGHSDFYVYQPEDKWSSVEWVREKATHEIYDRLYQYLWGELDREAL
jgi:hypothetical protein